MVQWNTTNGILSEVIAKVGDLWWWSLLVVFAMPFIVFALLCALPPMPLPAPLVPSSLPPSPLLPLLPRTAIPARPA